MKGRMFLSLGVLLTALGAAPTTQPEAEPAFNGKKIVPIIVRNWGNPQYRRLPVVLLGQQQLVDPPKGFDAFCKANANRKRSELRAETIARLKQIAKASEKAMLAGLSSAKQVRRLWIVNAVATTLTVADIKRASLNEAVKYIYLGHAFRNRPQPKKIAHVLKPTPRKPFTVEGKKIPWNLEKIGAAEVWRKLKVAGEGTVVAVIDSGCNYMHQDLKQAIWINEDEVPNNGKDDDNNGYVDDYYGYDFPNMQPDIFINKPDRSRHGTWTACLVGGDGTGGMVTGVAPRCKLMSLRGWGNYANTNLALAFQYALENGADVASMSFSIPGLGHMRGFWRMMCDHATCAGLVLVSGAGNFGPGAGRARQPKGVQIRVPEGIPSVICAGGVGRNGKTPPGFCSRGPVSWKNVKFYNDHPKLIKPDVCGFPGPQLGIIAAPTTQRYARANNGVAGNSFSSPHIAGVAALVLSANPELPAWRVKEILEATATDVGLPGKDVNTGAGLANAFKAVQMAISEKK